MAVLLVLVVVVVLLVAFLASSSDSQERQDEETGRSPRSQRREPPHGANEPREFGPAQTKWDPSREGPTADQEFDDGGVTFAFTMLCVKLASADGSVIGVEIDAIRENLSRAGFPAVASSDYVNRVLSHATGDPTGFEQYARYLAAECPVDLDREMLLLHPLFQVAVADGVLSESEAALLRRVSTILGVGRDRFQVVWDCYVVSEDAWADGELSWEQRQRRIDAYRRVFAVGFVVLAAKLTKADGRVTQSEVEGFRAALGRLPSGTANGVDVASLFNASKTSVEGFEGHAALLADLFEAPLLEALVDCLFHVAWADGEFHPAEDGYIRSVARLFGFDRSTLEEIRARWLGSFGGGGGVDPYAALGVGRSVSDAELKRCYRQLVLEHHPDRLAAKGLPAEHMEAANARLAAMNAAYDRILSERSA